MYDHITLFTKLIQKTQTAKEAERTGNKSNKTFYNMISHIKKKVMTAFKSTVNLLLKCREAIYGIVCCINMEKYHSDVWYSV
jgi:hypothetical protein